VLAECTRISAHPEVQGQVLLRIYYYDAPPATSIAVNPLSGKGTNLGRTWVFASRKRLQDDLELMPNVALRKGELTVHGWRVRDSALREIARSRRGLAADDLMLNIEQKGVDLRIGLDIARLALRQLVETLVVVTGDSDMIPAFKFARREGLRVFLDHLGGPVKRELKAHADLVL
jgi:uncharacterized LabA/DUF88 family protein